MNLQVHFFEYVRKFNPLSAVINGAVGEGQMRAVEGVNILRFQRLIAISIGCPGAVVTHLYELWENEIQNVKKKTDLFSYAE